jgi:hypothetical protein
MSLKNRVGNFLILFGLIALLVFGATVLAPPEAVDGQAFLAGAALLGVGLKFRLAKSPRGAPQTHAGPPPAAAGGPPPSAPARPRRQGLFATVLKGPAKPKVAPAPQAAPPAAKGGKGPKGGKGGRGGKGGKNPAGGGKSGPPPRRRK